MHFLLISPGMVLLWKTALLGLKVPRPQLAGKHALALLLVKGSRPPFVMFFWTILAKYAPYLV